MREFFTFLNVLTLEPGPPIAVTQQINLKIKIKKHRNSRTSVGLGQTRVFLHNDLSHSEWRTRKNV